MRSNIYSSHFFQALFPRFVATALVCLSLATVPRALQHCLTGQNETKEDLDKARVLCINQSSDRASTPVDTRTQLFCADIFRRFGRDAVESAKDVTPGLKGSGRA